MDRNKDRFKPFQLAPQSLSARRAWIEIATISTWRPQTTVALRKESVDRNGPDDYWVTLTCVALRKESVDRNTSIDNLTQGVFKSLSARRAWIEIVETT